jgi:hypothetical protein
MKALLVLVLSAISVLGAWSTDAQACSCERASRQQLRDVLPLSFDGRVIAVEIFSRDQFGVVRASVSVLRKIKGSVPDKIDVFAHYDNRVGCGAGSTFEALRATGQAVEFGVEPWRVDEFGTVPFVSMCTLSSSEIYPVRKELASICGARDLVGARNSRSLWWCATGQTEKNSA